MNYDEPFFRVGKYLKEGFKKLELVDLNFKFDESKRESYLGFSEIHGCPLCIYERLSGCQSRNTRSNDDWLFLKRIFMAGHIIEEVVVKALELGGGFVSGRQEEFADFNGEFRGHCDLYLDEDLIVEIKSMNDNNFNQFRNKGVFESHRHYYTQVQLYASYSQRTPVIIGMNKNNSDYHYQVLEKNPDYAEYYKRKARSILLAISTKNFEFLNSEFLQDLCMACKVRFPNYAIQSR